MHPFKFKVLLLLHIFFSSLALSLLYPDTLTESQTILSADSDANSYFGFDVSVEDDTMLVTEMPSDDAKIFEYTLESDTRTWKFTAKVCEGCRADAISMNGNVAAYGNILLGSVTVLRRQQSGQEWVQESVLTSSQATKDDFFGEVIAVSSKNTDIIVTGSSFRSSRSSGLYAGAFTIFESNGGPWKEVTDLVPSNAVVYSFCGSAVAVFGDIVIVSCDEDSLSKYSTEGVIYFYEKAQSGQWIESSRLVALDSADGDFFGSYLKISDSVLAVGANGVTSPQADWTGAVYLFELQGGVWTQRSKFVPPSDILVSNEDYYYFGISVAFTNDTLVIGAYGDADASSGNYNNYAGAAYCYKKGVDGTWVFNSKLLRSSRYYRERVGESVGIAAKNVLILSANGFNDNDGAVLSFSMP